MIKKMDKTDSSKVELETIQALYIPIGVDELHMLELSYHFIT